MSHGAVPIAIGAVAVVLMLGFYNMMRGGSANTSQKLMRLRVLCTVPSPSSSSCSPSGSCRSEPWSSSTRSNCFDRDGLVVRLVVK